MARLLMNVCAIAALVVGAAIQAASGPAIWAGLTAGPYRVGLSRIDRGGLEVTYWHPSTAGGEPMRLRDFALDADGFVKDAEDRGLPAAAAADYLDSPLHARLNAPRASGRFPLVLVGQGNGQGPLDQAVLAQFLASRGFVVATTPSPAIRSPMRSADDVGPLAQRQAEELRRAARLLDEQGRRRRLEERRGRPQLRRPRRSAARHAGAADQGARESRRRHRNSAGD